MLKTLLITPTKKQRRIIFLIGLLTLCFNITVFAQTQIEPSTQSIEDISSIIKPILDQYNLPGGIAAVIENDQLVAVGAAGVRKRGFSNPMKPQDLIHIGSDTKSMTATIAAQLVEKGLIQWNTRVIDVFPELRGKINPAYNHLTLEQLLTHRGGVISDIDCEKIQKGANNNVVLAREIAMEEALALQPDDDFPPGSFRYSNMGYIIAGHMLEKVSQRSWETLMEEFLFSPLQMTSAGFGPPHSAHSLDQPVGHHENGKPVGKDEYGDEPEIMGPAGTVHLSIFDWAKYINLHLQAAEGKPHLLSPHAFQKLQTPISNPPPSYAMGWVTIDLDWAKGKVLSHAGSNELWYAKVWIAPKRRMAIMIVFNQGGESAKEAANAAGLALMKHVLHLMQPKIIDTSH